MSDAGLSSFEAAARPFSLRSAGLVLALGSAGVVATSAFYKLSPAETVMVFVAPDMTVAASGAVQGAATMHLAGLIGIFGDVAISAAGLVLGMANFARGRGAATLGWLFIAISTVLFAIVDSLVGFVLSPVARGAASAFPVAKNLFDVLFLLGTATFGVGVIFAMAEQILVGGDVPRALAIPALPIGCVAAIGGTAGLFGIAVHPLVIGIGIGGGAVVFTLVGLSIAAKRSV